jgi:hypothetical protein
MRKAVSRNKAMFSLRHVGQVAPERYLTICILDCYKTAIEVM